MGKEITDEMLQEFNMKMLNEYNSPLKLKKEITLADYAVKITIEDKFIEYITTGLSNEFYNILIDFFNKYGIKLSFNNTSTIFWASDE